MNITELELSIANSFFGQNIEEEQNVKREVKIRRNKSREEKYFLRQLVSCPF